MEEIVDFIKNPDVYEKADAKVPKGILLVGPPGVGSLIRKNVVGKGTGE